MSIRHLVPFDHLPRLRYPQADEHVYAWRQLIAFGALLLDDDADVDDLAPLAVRHAKRRILDVAGFLSEYRAQQLLLGAELGLALGSNLPHQNVARPNLRADADDSLLVELAQAFLSHVRNITRDLFRAELGISRFHLVLLDVDGRELVIPNDALAQDDRVLEVVPLPAHEGHKHVVSQGKLTI